MPSKSSQSHGALDRNQDQKNQIKHKKPKSEIKSKARLSLEIPIAYKDSIESLAVSEDRSITELFKRMYKLYEQFGKANKEGEGMYTKRSDGSYERVIML